MDESDHSRESREGRRAYGTGGIFIKAGTWYVSYRSAGKTIRESTHLKVIPPPGPASEIPKPPAAVERFLQRRLAEVEEGDITSSPLRVKVGHLLDDLLEDHRVRGLSSLKTVKCHIEGKGYGLRKLFGHMKPSQVQRALNKVVIFWQEEHELEPATINKHLGTLRRAFNLGVETKKIGKGVVPTFPHLPEDNARQTYVGVSDMGNIIGEMPDDGARDFVDWLHGSSQRWGETASMEWTWFAPATWEIRIPGKRTKNRLPRVIPVVEHLRPIIERRIAGRKARLATGLPDSPYIFHRNGKKIHESWRKVWRTACERAGFIGKRDGGITPHDLRHIAATDMRRAGIPESIIMNIGGWETASMFRRYAITDTHELADNLAKLRAYRTAQAQQAPKVVPMRKAAGRGA